MLAGWWWMGYDKLTGLSSTDTLGHSQVQTKLDEWPRELTTCQLYFSMHENACTSTDISNCLLEAFNKHKVCYWIHQWIAISYTLKVFVCDCQAAEGCCYLWNIHNLWIAASAYFSSCLPEVLTKNKVQYWVHQGIAISQYWGYL